jgi:hypothetical protein
VATALHDGLRARQFYVGTKTLRHPKIRAADQEEAEIWLAQLLTLAFVLRDAHVRMPLRMRSSAKAFTCIRDAVAAAGR